MPEPGDAQRRAHITMKNGKKIDVTGLVVDFIEESRFEGRIIEHTWNNMGWTPKLIDKPRGNWKAGDAIALIGPKCDIIHISAHGYQHGVARDVQSNEGIRPTELMWLFDLEGPVKKLEKVVLIVNSACNSFSDSWVNLFTKKLGVQCYVGAEGKPEFDEGIVFPVAFYLKMWNKTYDEGKLTKEIVKMAFEEAKKSVRTFAKWNIEIVD